MAEREVVSKVTNATLYNDGTIKLENVRLSYPHLGLPFKSKNDAGVEESRWGVVAMLPKDTHKAAKDLVKKQIEKLCSDNDAKVATANWFLADGDEKELEDYAGHYIAATGDKTRRPVTRNRKNDVIDAAEADQLFYGGCWGDVLIRPWYFSGVAKNGKKYPKRVCSGIVAVKFKRDDEPFGDAVIGDDGIFDDDDSDSGFDDADGDDGL